MKETLGALVELQDLEDSLRDLRTLNKQLVTLRNDNAASRQMFQMMLSERNAQLDEIRTFCKEKEAEIKGAEDVARRARGRLSSIQSQRELTALNKELDTARRMNAPKSEELLKLMEQLEAATADFEKKTNEFNTLDEQMTAAEQEIEAKIQDGEAAAGAQTERRDELRAMIDRPTLSRFDRVLAGRDGIAVANVIGDTCTACQIAVSPQVKIRLMRMATLEECNHCRRYIVWREGLMPAVTDVEDTPEAVTDA
ncbi:MAG: hypothetical protein VYA30_10155 [Myxococcota bacterium]|nr:hypothetical protein [Myxococcota bacterium]